LGAESDTFFSKVLNSAKQKNPLKDAPFILNMPSLEKLDELDYEIIRILQADPTQTHSQIAKQLNRSQPAIGARIKKLQDAGLLATQIGVDFHKVTDFTLIRVDIVTTKAKDVLELANYCPYVINAMRLSGEYNISVLMASTDLKRLDAVIDRHYRLKPYVKKTLMERITDVATTFILPMNLKAEEHVCDENDPCEKNPLCREMRAKANVRPPEEIMAALEQPSPSTS
jgi:Lrp/AsnC family leucine-responsive transcriptional regulator